MNASRTVPHAPVLGPISACASDDRRVFLCQFAEGDDDKPVLARTLTVEEARSLADELLVAVYAVNGGASDA